MQLSGSYKSLTKPFLLLTLLLSLTACVSKPQPTFSTIKQHMIESDKLNVLIHELNTVVYNRAKSELEKDELRRRYALKYAKTIKQIAQNIQNLGYNQKGQKISEDEKKSYASFAKRLYKNGEDIQKVASEYKLEKLTTELIKAERTCNACHSKFRNQL